MDSSLKGAVLEKKRNFNHFNDSLQWTGRTWFGRKKQQRELSCPQSLRKKEISPESSYVSGCS